MNTSPTPDTVTGPEPTPRPAPRAGVGGWLLVLCAMLTVVGPLISIWIVGEQFDASVPRYATSRGAQWAMIATVAATTCSVLYGIYAGIALWTIRPKAVTTARRALGLGLVVDVATTTISTSLDRAASAGDGFYDVLWNLAPSLVFFTLCIGFLNRSRRVEATYPLD